MKPQTEIRNLKHEVKQLRSLCLIAGVPLIIVYMPDLALKKGKPVNLSKAETKWLKEKTREWEQVKKQK